MKWWVYSAIIYIVLFVLVQSIVVPVEWKPSQFWASIHAPLNSPEPHYLIHAALVFDYEKRKIHFYGRWQSTVYYYMHCVFDSSLKGNCWVAIRLGGSLIDYQTSIEVHWD